MSIYFHSISQPIRGQLDEAENDMLVDDLWQSVIKILDDIPEATLPADRRKLVLHGLQSRIARHLDGLTIASPLANEKIWN